MIVTGESLELIKEGEGGDMTGMTAQEDNLISSFLLDLRWVSGRSKKKVA